MQRKIIVIFTIRSIRTLCAHLQEGEVAIQKSPNTLHTLNSHTRRQTSEA